MAVVSSYGALATLQGLRPVWWEGQERGLRLYAGYWHDYLTIYRTQPNVRIVVDFLSRNLAQIGLHAFRRLSGTDRERLTGHSLVQTLGRPNPATTRYRLIEALVADLGIHFNAYWLKVRTPGRLGLVRLPPEQVTVKGGLIPTQYRWSPTQAAPTDFAPSEIVHFRGFNPASPLFGLSPMETLRRILAEAHAAAEYREQFWGNAARTEIVLTRPAAAPPWKADQRKQFRDEWQEFAGAGVKAGKAPVLEDGMEPKVIGFNAKDSQYLEGVKLGREICAAAYHIPLPMVGILDHATFSNIREQHKKLYQDCLAPWTVMIEEELELQLLPEFDDVEGVYLEFNIAEKLKGSFEEQSESLSKAIGRPYMSPNEGRARLNLPRDPDPESDRIARNLNQATGSTSGGRFAADHSALAAVVHRHFARQSARTVKAESPIEAFDGARARWDRELAADLAPFGLSAESAVQINAETAALLEAGEDPWVSARAAAIVERLAAPEERTS